MLGCLLLTLYYSSPAPYSPPFPCSLLSVFQRLWVWNLHFSESQPVRFWVRFQQWKASTKSGKQRGSRAIKFPAAAIGSCMSSVNFRRKQMWLSSSFQVPLLALCPFGVAEAKNISDGFLQFLKLPGFQKTSGSFPWLLVHPPQLLIPCIKSLLACNTKNGLIPDSALNDTSFCKIVSKLSITHMAFEAKNRVQKMFHMMMVNQHQ